MTIIKRPFDKDYPYEIKDAWGGSIVLDEEDFNELTGKKFTEDELKMIKEVFLKQAAHYQHTIDNTPTKHISTIYYLKKRKKYFEQIAKKA